MQNINAVVFAAFPPELPGLFPQPQGDVDALATFKDMYFYQQIVAWPQPQVATGQHKVSSLA